MLGEGRQSSLPLRLTRGCLGPSPVASPSSYGFPCLPLSNARDIQNRVKPHSHCMGKETGAQRVVWLTQGHTPRIAIPEMESDPMNPSLRHFLMHSQCGVPATLEDAEEVQDRGHTLGRQVLLHLCPFTHI